MIHGYVISIAGTLEIKDTTGNSGLVTGGFNNDPESAGCINTITNSSAKITLTSGTISGNRSVRGGITSGHTAGAIMVKGSSTFTMTGGIIENNISDYVGGVYAYESGAVFLSGGIIRGNIGNIGGGIRAIVLNLSGSPQVKDNIGGATINTNTCVVTPNTGHSDDLRLTSDANSKINVVGKLGDNASFGVISSSQSKPYTFTSGYGANNGNVVNPKHFFAHLSNESIGVTTVNGNKELQFVNV